MLECGYNPGWLTGQSRAASTESSASAPYWRVVYRPTGSGAVAVVASDESILSRLQPKDLELPADHDLRLSLCPGTSSTPPPSGRLLQASRASVPKELGRGFLVAEVRSEGARPALKPLAGDSTTGLAAALGPLTDRIGSAGVAPEANWLFAKWNDGALDLVLAVFAASPNGGGN